MKFFEYIDEQSASKSIRFQSHFSFSEYENESAFEAIKNRFCFPSWSFDGETIVRLENLVFEGPA